MSHLLPAPASPIPAHILLISGQSEKARARGRLCLDSIIIQSIEQPGSSLEGMLNFWKSLRYCNQGY